VLQNWPKNHQRVLDVFRDCFADVDKITQVVSDLHYRRSRAGQASIYETNIGTILAKLGKDGPDILVNFYVKPAEHTFKEAYWHSQSVWGNPLNRDAVLNRIAAMFASNYVELNPSQYSADALLGRLRHIFSNPQNHCEIEKPEYYPSEDYQDFYLYPTARDVFSNLSAHMDCSGVVEFLTDFFCGRYNIRTDRGADRAYDRYVDSCKKLIGSGSEEFDFLLPRLFEREELTYELFDEFCRYDPNLVSLHKAFGKDHRTREGSPLQGRVMDRYRDCLRQTIRLGADQLPENADWLCKVIGGGTVPGLEWLEIGLNVIRDRRYTTKDLHQHTPEASAVRTLIASEGLVEGESDNDLAALLKRYDADTLLLALPSAGYARNAILEVLGWDDIVSVQNCLFDIAGGSVASVQDLADIPNGESIESGVIDRARVIEIIEAADAKRLDRYLKSLRVTTVKLGNTLMLFDALRGKDRVKLEKKLDKHAQCAIKAYGLYPVDGPEDLRARYLKFKAMHKEATKYGSERQTNTQAAVKVGLKNLAQAAGYADEIRLEWQMEADIAESMVPMNRPLPADAWEVILELEGITPRIRVLKDGKTLKSVPAKVREQKIYQLMREAQEAIKGQASRFRNALEDMMANGELISGDELLLLNRLPVVRSMLQQLIIVTEDGQTGLYLDVGTLVGIDGDFTVAGPHRIAHVVDLLNLGCLSHWQQYLVERQLVQPFKQAFRELYVVTPAEIEADTHSRRFCGQVVDGRTASRLLQGRGWAQLSGDVAEIYKRFPKSRLIAEILFPDAGHYLAENETVMMDEIFFRSRGEFVRLDQVDPYIFSEVMRDADLVASVAQVSDGDARWSTEVVERRGDVVRALFQRLALTSVSCVEHFAYIKGKLATYRVHLGSGVIHIQPGNYLCIVPSGSHSESLYLPFADTDNKMTEIISKIFLLIEDDKIKDESILRQISPSAYG